MEKGGEGNSEDGIGGFEAGWAAVEMNYNFFNSRRTRFCNLVIGGLKTVTARAPDYRALQLL